jgi:hypothetical protein
MGENMIRNRLLEINQETWNSEKLDLTETFIKKLLFDYSTWLVKYKRLNSVSWAYTDKELLEIYENENRR